MQLKRMSSCAANQFSLLLYFLTNILIAAICSPAKVSIKPILKKILLKITGEYMKESNIIAGNAANISLKKEVWMNTKEEYMN